MPAVEGRVSLARSAGVREGSGEETAGRLRSVAPLVMGIVSSRGVNGLLPTRRSASRLNPDDAVTFGYTGGDFT